MDDLRAAMASLGATGIRWSSVQHPLARLRLADRTVEEIEVGYVASSGGQPRLKIIGGRSGTYFTPTPGVHHLSYWVDDLDRSTGVLVEAGYLLEATGEEADGSPRYRYLLSPEGLRVELGMRAHRAEFDAWAEGLLT